MENEIQKTATDTMTWLVRGGQMGEAFRKIKWDDTALGASHLWSLSFKQNVNFCLSMSSPALLIWGAHRTVIFNDAYLRLVGPQALADFASHVRESAFSPAVLKTFDFALSGRGTECRETLDQKLLQITTTPIMDFERQTEGIFVSLIDLKPADELDESHAADTFVLKNEDRYRLMFSHESIHVVLVNAKGQIIHVNEAFLAATGYDAADLMGRSFSEFSHPDDTETTLLEMDKLYYRQQATVTFEKRYICKDQSVLWVQTSVSPSFGPAGDFRYVVSVSQDISEHKLREAEVLAAREEAVRANKSKSAFLANMSHEIRTPLGIIRGFADLLLESDTTSANELDSKIWLEGIRRNSHELTKLVDDILDLAKVEAEHLSLEQLPIHLVNFIEELVAGLEMKSRENSVKLSMAYAANLPEVIHSDPTRLRQILLNVIGNSIKFTHAGMVHIHLTSEPLSQNRARIRVQIKDTGIGMTAEQAHSLFQPFMQADVSTTRRFGGSGLGLALSKRLAAALGGDLVLIETAIDQGTCFEFRLDTEISADHARNSNHLLSDPPRSQASGRELKDRKILVVDDSADNRLLISRYLTRQGAIVDIAVDGLDGVRQAGLHRYDAIVMDIQMPRLDGYQACSQLRAAGNTRPILALTAHAMRGERERCMELGFNGYLTKPIESESLIKTLKTFCQQN